MSEDQVRYELHGVELTDRQREKMSLKLNKLFKFDASVSTTFEEALDGALEALHRQLEKRSGKRIQNRGAEVNE